MEKKLEFDEFLKDPKNYYHAREIIAALHSGKFTTAQENYMTTEALEYLTTTKLRSRRQIRWIRIHADVRSLNTPCAERDECRESVLRVVVSRGDVGSGPGQLPSVVDLTNVPTVDQHLYALTVNNEIAYDSPRLTHSRESEYTTS